MSEALLDEYIKDWGRQKADSTVYSRRKVLESFDEDVGLEGATKSDIYDWLDMKIEDGLKKMSANRYISMFKKFFRWYRDNLPVPVGEDELRRVLENQKRSNRIINMDGYRAADSSVEPIPGDIFLGLLEGADESDRYLFYLLGYFGLRKSELYGLRDDDVDLKDNSLHIRAEETKTYRERTLYYADSVGGMLEDMMDASESPYLIGFEAPKNYLNTRLRWYDEMIREHVTPHQFRHTFVHNMRQKLEDNLLVKWLAGHQTSQDMTARYSKPVEDVAREAMVEDHYYLDWGIL